jgi:bacteriorhodopsin
MAAHWITFISMFACTLFLGYTSWTAKGPSSKQRYFAGYHEEYNISFYVNLFASISYFGKCMADVQGQNFADVGPFIVGLGNYSYADYMFTCPMLVFDLLTQLRVPYRIPAGALIYAVLLTGSIANFYPGPSWRTGAWGWFAFAATIYTFAYVFVYMIVIKQYKRLNDLSAGTEAKKAMFPLKLAIVTFFSMWLGFPVVWVLSSRTGMNLLSEDAVQILHCIFDLIAKSVFGFALARFRSYYDKKMYEMVDALHLGEDVDIEEALEKGIHGLDNNIIKNKSEEGKSLFEQQVRKSHTGADVPVWSQQNPARNSVENFPALAAQQGGVADTAAQIAALNSQIDRLSGGNRA